MEFPGRRSAELDGYYAAIACRIQSACPCLPSSCPAPNDQLHALQVTRNRWRDRDQDWVVPGVSCLLPIEFDLVASCFAAITGVWEASRRGYDLVDAFTLALVISIGRGLLRDSDSISQLPLVMQDARYLWPILAALAVGALTYRYSERVYGVFGTNWGLIVGLARHAAVAVVCATRWAGI